MSVTSALTAASYGRCFLLLPRSNTGGAIAGSVVVGAAAVVGAATVVAAAAVVGAVVGPGVAAVLAPVEAEAVGEVTAVAWPPGDVAVVVGEATDRPGVNGFTVATPSPRVDVHAAARQPAAARQTSAWGSLRSGTMTSRRMRCRNVPCAVTANPAGPCAISPARWGCAQRLCAAGTASARRHERACRRDGRPSSAMVSRRGCGRSRSTSPSRTPCRRPTSPAGC